MAEISIKIVQKLISEVVNEIPLTAPITLSELFKPSADRQALALLVFVLPIEFFYSRALKRLNGSPTQQNMADEILRIFSPLNIN